jgi:acyl-CoA thioesterase
VSQSLGGTDALPSGDAAALMMAADRASAALGIELVDYGLGWARTTMTVRADMVNGFAIAHGGLLFTLADTAFACACNSWGPVVVASGAEMTFIAPARQGDVLEAHAQARSRFGRNSIFDATVRCGEDVIAEFRGHGFQLATRP